MRRLDVGYKLALSILVLVSGITGALLLNTVVSPLDPPPLVCVETARTGHPEVPGVFIVTHVCKVDVSDVPEWTPSEQGSRT